MSTAGLRRVVITGSGIGSPAGYSVEENTRAWREGRATFSEITRFNTKGSSVRWAGECPNPDPKKLPDRKVQKILRRKDVISLLVTLDAAKSAGIETGKVDPERFGMYVGAGATQIGDLTPYFELVGQCVDVSEGKGTFDSASFGTQLMSLVNPLVVLQTLMNNGLCFGSMTLDIRGVNTNFMDFQAAGLRAIGEAFLSVAYGRADIVIAGGVAGPVEPFQLAEGVHTGYLARTRDIADGVHDVVKPWDAAREGAILSEGSAYIVVEDEAHALKRGVKILARVEGFGLSTDGGFDFMAERNSPGLARAMNGALSQASFKAADVDFIVGHGNGSIHADRAEAQAYRDFFGAHAGKVPLTSCKAVLGDMGEAGGVVGVMQALDAFQTGTVPPTQNFKNPDEFSRGLAIKAEPQPVPSRPGSSPRALVTSRNFLGLCAALVVSAA